MVTRPWAGCGAREIARDGAEGGLVTGSSGGFVCMKGRTGAEGKRGCGQAGGENKKARRVRAAGARADKDMPGES